MLTYYISWLFEINISLVRPDRRSVGWSVCYYFLKGREVTLPWYNRRTCYISWLLSPRTPSSSSTTSTPTSTWRRKLSTQTPGKSQKTFDECNIFAKKSFQSTSTFSLSHSPFRRPAAFGLVGHPRNVFFKKEVFLVFIIDILIILLDWTCTLFAN